MSGAESAPASRAGAASWAAIAPGVILTLLLAACASALVGTPFGKDTLRWSPLLLVILLGIAWRTLAPLPAAAEAGVRFAQRPVLRWAVAGLGFRLSLGEIWALGPAALFVVLLSTGAALAFGIWIAGRLGLPHKLGLLLGVGGAICGASAVVAADSVVQAEKRDAAIALGTITLLGTIGIVLYPPIGRLLGLSDRLYGVWDGASLHEMAQVVAAGFGFSDEAGRLATVVKLARITLLAPTVLWLAWSLRRHHEAAGAARVAPVPWFLVLFVVFAALNSFGVVPKPALELVRRVDLWLLCIGMAGVGLATGLRDIASAGARPIAAAALQWLVLAALSLGLAWGWTFVARLLPGAGAGL